MYLGKIVELSPAEELYDKPIHPYTVGAAGRDPDPGPAARTARASAIVVGGEPPNPIDPPSGCRFHTRCPRATELCRTVEPPLSEYANGHLAACHHPLNVTAEEMKASTKAPDSPLESGETPPEPLPASAARAEAPTAPAGDH